MEEARNLTKAERCSLFLVDHDAGELIAKVFDGVESPAEVSPRLNTYTIYIYKTDIKNVHYII